MMRGLALLPVLFCVAATAQNWALLNPAYKYNYSNDGSDTISNQIFVTHIDTLGVDSFRYELNRIGVVCDTCGDNNSSCFVLGGMIKARTPQFLGGGMLYLGNDQWLRSTDSLLIETDAHLGDHWISPNGITALVIAEDIDMVFGTQDSVKRVAFTSGDTLSISKDHGVLNLSTDEAEYDLVGIEGLEVGSQFPTTRTFFNYSPGDVLQYRKDGSNVAGNEYHMTTSITKYRFLNRVDTVGRTDYDIRFVRHSLMTAYDVLDGFAFIGSYPSTAVDTFVLSVEHDHWTPANSFGCSWFNTLWPRAVCDVNEEGLGEFTTLMDVHRDLDIGYSLKAGLSPLDDFSTVLCTDQYDSTRLAFTSAVEFQREYIEGIGLVYERYYLFEVEHTVYLIGSLLNGVQTGTIYSDGSMVGTEEPPARSALRVFPVPTSDELHLAAARTIRHWIVTDHYGRQVDQGWINASVGSINTSALPAGIYILHVGNADRSEVSRFVIAR